MGRDAGITRITDRADLPDAICASIPDGAENIAVKVHFGRTKKPGSHLDPAIFRPLISSRKRVTFVDTNTLYGGERRTTERHLAVAARHGFSPAKILEEDNLVGIGKNITIPAELEDYDVILNAAHFTGHKIVGFGGTLKNAGMGMVSRGTKLWVHNKGRLSYNPERCNGCGWCIENCEYLASKGKESECTRCAACVGECTAMSFSFGKAIEVASRLMVSACTVLNWLPNVVNLAVADNPTVLCDCMGSTPQVMTRDFFAAIGDKAVEVDNLLVSRYQRFLLKHYSLQIILGQSYCYTKWQEENYGRD